MICLQLRVFGDLGGWGAAAGSGAGVVVVGRGAADRDARAARGPGADRRAAERSGAAGADPSGVGSRVGAAWPADDRDGDLCAADGGPSTHGLGLRDVGSGGVGLVASAT